MQLPEKYVILEIIPTSLHPSRGDIIQLSALKLNNLKLLDRFDYRLNENKIYIDDFKKIIDYDKDQFIYKDSSKEIIDEFKKFIGDLPLLIIDNTYTKNYLNEIENEKVSIFKFVGKEYNDNIIEDLIREYEIQKTNHIVDILYEVLIKTQ